MMATASLCKIRISRWKLNMVAKTIRRHSVGEALRILAGSKKRVAQDVRKVLLSAMANAQHNKGLKAEDLTVAEATVGRSLILKRSDLRGRSRVGRIEKELSQIRIVLVEE